MPGILAIKDLRIALYHSARNAPLFTLSTTGKISGTQMSIFSQYAHTSKRIKAKFRKLSVFSRLLEDFQRLGIFFRSCLIT